MMKTIDDATPEEWNSIRYVKGRIQKDDAVNEHPVVC